MVFSVLSFSFIYKAFMKKQFSSYFTETQNMTSKQKLQGRTSLSGGSPANSQMRKTGQKHLRTERRGGTNIYKHMVDRESNSLSAMLDGVLQGQLVDRSK